MATYRFDVEINETDNGQDEIWQGTASITSNVGDLKTVGWYATPLTIFINDQEFKWPGDIAGGSVHGAIIAVLYQSDAIKDFLQGL